MKRRVIIVGIVAVVLFIFYQFLFGDRRSRLKVGTDKIGYELSTPSAVESAANGGVSFNEAVYLPEKDRSSAQSEVIERKLMKEGVIDFQVNDIVATRNSINSLIKQFNAYAASHKEDEYSGGPQYQTVVRIPSGKLEEFVSRLEPLAKKVRSKNLSSKDVTDEYIDLSARIATKRDLEKNYREILRKATKVSEMLEVERQLEEVRGAIESMEGRIEFINSHVTYSDLTITYFQLIIQDNEEAFGQKVANSLDNGWFNLLEFIVDVLYAWPWLIIGPVAIWLSIRWARKSALFAQRPITNS
jgi:hypothetical protein